MTFLYLIAAAAAAAHADPVEEVNGAVESVEFETVDSTWLPCEGAISFDDRGNAIRTTYVFEDSVTVRERFYARDGTLGRFKETTDDAPGRTLHYTYDENGLLEIETECYAGELYSRTWYTAFDRKGRPIRLEKQRYSDPWERYRNEYFYEDLDAGSRTTMDAWNGDALESTVTLTYDSGGMLLEDVCVTSEAGGLVTVHTYAYGDYDGHGNWTMCRYVLVQNGEERGRCSLRRTIWYR